MTEIGTQKWVPIFLYLDNFDKTWSGSCEELDVTAFGYTSVNGDLFLGGL